MRPESRIWDAVAEAVGGMSGGEAFDYLRRSGLIGRREAEAFYIRRRVGELVSGERMPRCRAMEKTADEMCCSYEKVKGLIYRKNKQ